MENGNFMVNGPHKVMNTAWKNMYESNVVEVNNQSANSKIFLLLCDWLFTTTIFVPYIFFQAVMISTPHYRARNNGLYVVG